jgi:carboxyl-terminal processing protease
MEQRYRDRPAEIYRVESPGAYLTQPLAVLVNANTASAAEIIAGALKAPGRAWVIGQATYGKDSIQLIFELNDRSSLHVTSARWAIPGLEPPIGSGGLLPDIELPTDTPPDSPAWEQAAVELLLVQARQPGTP